MSPPEMPSDALSPMAVLDEARKAVPAVNYALGVAGVAAAAAIVTAFVGRGTGGMIVVGSAFVGMILLFVFSRLVISPSPSIQFAGVVLVWIVLVFFGTFLVLTATAVIFTKPCNWAQFLGISSDCRAPLVKPDARTTSETPAGPATPEAEVTHFAIMPEFPAGTVSKRDWRRLTPDRWVEIYSASGIQTFFEVKGRIILDGCAGTKVANQQQPSHLAFIPDKGCPGMPFKINDDNRGWGIVSPMTEYQ
jgi:hypothetical protein